MTIPENSRWIYRYGAYRVVRGATRKKPHRKPNPSDEMEDTYGVWAGVAILGGGFGLLGVYLFWGTPIEPWILFMFICGWLVTFAGFRNAYHNRRRNN